MVDKNLVTAILFVIAGLVLLGAASIQRDVQFLIWGVAVLTWGILCTVEELT